MAYEVSEQPAAKQVLDNMASDPAMSHVLDAIERTIEMLSEDPYNRRLATTAFQAELLGNISATPVRVDDWYVFWRRGTAPRTLVIVLVSQLSTR